MEMHQRIEPIGLTYTSEELAQLEEIKATMARIFDGQIVAAFMRSRDADRSGRCSAVRSHIENGRLQFVPIPDKFLYRQEPLPTCAECQKPELTQTYTSQRDGREICLACFEGRQAKGLAKEKKVHPLDAWQHVHD